MGKERTDTFTRLEDAFAGYKVVDRDGEQIGKVDDLFVDENDKPEYIGVKMGFFGTRSTLIPAEITRTDEEQKTIEVATEKSHAKDGPTFEDDREITPEFETEVLRYFGLDSLETDEEHSPYSGTYGAREERTHASQNGEDELRVQRTEEELRAGTRERQVGAVRVRKRVHTDRERIEVPTRHEEVRVERVSVEGEASEAEIGEDEIVVPVNKEEVVTDKRAVVKEEVRIHKDAVEDKEVVEEDVRREEVDVEEDTARGQD